VIHKVLASLLHIFLPLFFSVLWSAEAQGLTMSAPALSTSSAHRNIAELKSAQSASITKPSSSVPLEKIHVTSKFGTRKHPVLKKTAFHGGVDMRARLNDNVKSIADGIVTFSGPRGALGNAVFISHPKLKATSIYGHLNKVVVGKGRKVKAGNVIGYAGTTGRSTGVHLHLTVKDQNTGKSVEPISFLASIDKKTAAKAAMVAYRDKTSRSQKTFLASSPKLERKVSVVQSAQIASTKEQRSSHLSYDKQEKLTLRTQASPRPILFTATTAENVIPRTFSTNGKPPVLLAAGIETKPSKSVQAGKVRSSQDTPTPVLAVSVKPNQITVSKKQPVSRGAQELTGTVKLAGKTKLKKIQSTKPKKAPGEIMVALVKSAVAQRPTRSLRGTKPIQVAQAAKVPPSVKLATKQVKKEQPKLVLRHHKASPIVVVAASRSQLAKTKTIASLPTISPRQSDFANERVAGLRSAIDQAVANAQNLQGLYSEGIVARKQYLAAEQKVSQLREELRNAQSKS
jgi:hypothetical protein